MTKTNLSKAIALAAIILVSVMLTSTRALAQSTPINPYAQGWYPTSYTQTTYHGFQMGAVVASDGKFVYAVASGQTGTTPVLYQMSLATGSRIGSTTLTGAGLYLQAIVCANGYLFIGDGGNDQIFVVNLAGSSPFSFTTIPVMAPPIGLAWDGPNGWIWAALGTLGVANQIVAFNPTTGAQTNQITGIFAHALAVDNAGNLWTSAPALDAVTIINTQYPATVVKTINNLEYGNTTGLAYDGINMWVMNGNPGEVNYIVGIGPGPNYSIIQYIPAANVNTAYASLTASGGMIWSADFTSSFTGTITGYSTITGAAVNSFPVAVEAYTICMSGNEVWAGNLSAGTVTRITNNN